LHPLLSLSRTAVRFWLIVDGQLSDFLVTVAFFSEKRRNAQGIAQNGARHVIFRIRIVEVMFVSYTEGFETAAIPA
jgi:hypothetical protein